MGSILVKKFGGTSVQDVQCILKVAEIIQKDVALGHKVIVVVSAMGRFTDETITIAKEVSELKSDEQLAEYDLVLSAGEQISCGLLSLALQNKKIKVRSWLSWQLPINTTGEYSRARIVDIDVSSLRQCIVSHDVAVVAGFQGVCGNRVTTLGRGGSDTSAVAIAAALKLDTCYIYTDVAGVYTANPSLVPRARKLDYLTHDEMMEMSSLGAEVLQVRSVEMAAKYGITLHVLSAFEGTKGTIISGDGEKLMEDRLITGITSSTGEIGVTLKGVFSASGIAAVFSSIAEYGINVDMVIRAMEDRYKDITFTIQKNDFEKTQELLAQLKLKEVYEDMKVITDLAKVSVVGVGMVSCAGITGKMFSTLENNGISILAITTSEIKISVLTYEHYVKSALVCLHTAFGLDSPEICR